MIRGPAVRTAALWKSARLLNVFALTVFLTGMTSLSVPSSSTTALSQAVIKTERNFLNGQMPQPQGRATGEPGMAVDGGGTIWVSSILAGQPPTPQDPTRTYFQGTAIWKSTDNGLSYQWVVDPMQILPVGPAVPLAGNDSDIAAAPIKNADGFYNVYAVTLYPSNNTVAISRDGGRIWIPDVLGGLPGIVDRPWIAADGACVFYLAYHNGPYWVVNRYDLCDPLGNRVSRDPVSSVAVFPESNATFTLAGKIAVDTSPASRFRSNVYLPMEACSEAVNVVIEPEGSPTCANVPNIVVTRSTDRGGSWQASVVAPVPNKAMPIWNPQVATDAAGNVYVVWHDNFDSFISRSSDGGVTWTPPLQLNGPESATAVYPTVAGGAANVVEVAWYGTNRDGDANSQDVMGAPADRSSAEWVVWWAGSVDGGFNFEAAVASPQIHYGLVCTRGSSCANASRTRTLFDDFGIVIPSSTGLATIAYTSDQPHGVITRDFTGFATMLPSQATPAQAPRLAPTR